MKISQLKTVGVLTACLALGVSGTAMAATASQSEQAEINQLQTAKISPIEALQTAEQSGNGHAVGFGYEVNGNTNAYEVTLASGSQLHVVQIDPASGKVIKHEKVASDSLTGDGLPASALGQASKAQTSLPDALKAVDKQANGRALEASYVMHQGQLGIDVDVAASGKIESYRVDPQTGAVSQVKSSENEMQEGQGSEGSGDQD